jgi:hypothetical protein
MHSSSEAEELSEEGESAVPVLACGGKAHAEARVRVLPRESELRGQQFGVQYLAVPDVDARDVEAVLQDA